MPLDWTSVAQAGLNQASASAGGGFLSGIFGDGGHSTRKNMREQNNLNKDFADWNLDNIWTPTFQAENDEYQRRWEQDAEYNSPSAQAERMKEAGFYPTGEGFQAGGVSVQGSQPQYAQPADLASIMQAVQLKRQTDLQALSLTSQIEKTNAETAKVKSETKVQDKFNNFAEQWYQSQIDLNRGQLNLFGSQIDLNRQSIQQIQSNIKEIEARIDKYRQDIEESQARTTTYETSNFLMTSQAKKALSDIGLNNTQIRHLQAQIRQIGVVTDGYVLSNKINDIVFNAYYRSGVYGRQVRGEANLTWQSYNQNKGYYDLYMERNKLRNPAETGRFADVINAADVLFGSFGSPLSRFQDFKNAGASTFRMAAGAM